MLTSLLIDHFGPESAFEFMFIFAGLDLRLPKDLELQRLRSEWMKNGKKTWAVPVRGENVKKVVRRIMTSANGSQNGHPGLKRRRRTMLRQRSIRDCAGQMPLF